MTERGAQFPDDDETFTMPEGTQQDTVGKRSIRSIGQHYVKDWLAQTPCDRPHGDKPRCASCKHTGGMMSVGRLGTLIGVSEASINNIVSQRRKLGPDVAQRIADVINPGQHFSTLLAPPPQPEPSVGSSTDKFTARMRTQPPVRM